MTIPDQQTEDSMRVNRIAAGHELRMINLEQEVNELCQHHGEALRYALELEPDIKPVPVEAYPVASRDGLMPLDAVLCTGELTRRPTRPPDYETENRALAVLVQALAESPRTILQVLADTILDIFKVDSAGISLLTRDQKSFVWPAIAGAWRAHTGGGTPRDFGPCGDVLDRNTPLLFKHPERRYAYFLPMTPLAQECLLIPFYVKGKAVGTIWAVAHDDRRKFDAEDLRQLETLGRFASAAYQAAQSLDAAHAMMEDALQSRQEMEKLNAELRESEEHYRMLFESLDEGFCVIEKVEGETGEALDFRFVEANPAFAAHSGVSSVVGKTMRQLFPGESEEWFLTYDAVCRTGEPIRFEREFVNKARVLELYAFRVEDQTHRRVAINFQDITERKRAEEQLRQNRDTFFNLIENAPFGLYVVDAQFRLRQVSSAAQKVFSNIHPLIGRDFEEVLRLVWTDPFVSEALKRFRHTLQTGEPYAAPNTTQQRHNIGDVESYDWKIERLTLPDGQFGVVCYFYDITARKQAEHALRESEAFSRSILKSSHDCIKVLDLEGNLISMESGQELLGIEDIQPFLNKSWLDFWTGEDRPAAQAAVESAAAGRSGNFVGFFRTLRGEPKWWDVAISPVLDTNGKPARLIAVSRDVTQRQQAEQALRESEERYRNLFNSMDEGFCIIEMMFDGHQKPVDYRFLEVNPAFEKQTGMHDVTGRRVREMIPDLEAHWFEIYGQVALTGKPVRILSEVKALDRWLDIHAARLGGPENRQVAVIFDNVTEHKKSEEALRQSEERLRLAAEAAHFGTYDRDLGGAYFHISTQIKQMLGYEPDAPVSHPQVMSHTHPDDQAAGVAAFQRACDPAGDGQIAAEQRIVRRDGAVRWIASVGRVLFENGAPRRSIGFWVDITERKRLEQETLEQTQALAELDRRKDEFLAMLSHELRNPLAALSSAVQLLRLHKNEDSLQQQARSIIERQVGQLKHLVDDLLEISRITTGRVRLRQERISVSGIVERAVETVQPLIAQRRHQLRVALPPESVFLHADAARLEQVLVNLLTNAAKYSDEGGRIWLSVEREGDTAVLRVRDTGIGIAPELLPRIFELFSQAERSIDRSQGGLGIGLCLVQRLVELHGGTVKAHSVLGQGSEFVVRLPVMLTALPVSPSPALGAIQPPRKGCRVLAVDDNVDAVQSLAMLLNMSGHEVQIAYDGPSALEAALAMRPDVVLLDIGLPGLTGFEVAQQIRQQPALKNIVLVALTGYGRETDRQFSQEAGFDHHLVKPADFGEVEQILASVAKSAA